jgi:hypothetical protein
VSARAPLTPFWERRGSPNHDAHRLLLISYHFPPDTTIGARRWEKLAHAVTERGWGLDVITHAPDEEIGDALDSLPPGVRVFGVPDPTLGVERVEHMLWRVYRAVWPNRRLDASAARAGASRQPRALRARPASIDRSDIRPSVRTRDLLRTYWAWVDFTHGARWAQCAAAVAKRIAQSGVHEAVITSGPPHMSHEAGRLASIATGLPFVMDMRDPWSLQRRLPESMASPLWYRLAERHERTCIEQAALVVANTEPARAILAALHPDARSRIITVMNGSDDEPLPPRRDRGRFVIGYAGTIYLDRDPQCLFRAVARVVAAEGLSPAQFGIEILGPFTADERAWVLGLADQEGIADFVTVEPLRPHRAALEFLAGAIMLVTFAGYNLVAIPAKVFEYVRFDAWLLALSEPGSATAQLLQGTSADVVAPFDVEAIAAAITVRYHEYVAGVRPTRVARDDRFSRRAQARILLDAIARLIPANGARGGST